MKESGSYIKQIRQVSCRSYITRYFFNPIWQEFILSIHLQTEKNDLQINLKKQFAIESGAIKNDLCLTVGNF